MPDSTSMISSLAGPSAALEAFKAHHRIWTDRLGFSGHHITWDGSTRLHGLNGAPLGGDQFTISGLADEDLAEDLARWVHAMLDSTTTYDDEPDETEPLWRTNKNGSMSLNSLVLADMVRAFGPLRTDAGGGIWAYEHGVFSPAKTAVRNRVATILGNSYSREAVGKAEDHIASAAKTIDLSVVAHPDLINFQDCMVNWRTGAVLPHDPDLGSTFQLSTVHDETAECPVFDRWMEAMLPEDVRHLVWQVIGYSMLPYNPQQVFIFLEGEGGNGKGVILRLIKCLLGAINVAELDMTEIDGGNQFTLSSLIGKAANISGETTPGYIKNSSNLKKITGGDGLKIERKGQDAFMAQIHALPIFAGNEVPRLADDSAGLQQRVVVAPFHRPARENVVSGFTEGYIHEHELPGIARKGLEALRTVQLDDTTKRANGFAITAELQEARNRFEEATNAELEWLRHYVVPKKDHWVRPMDLYREYGGTKLRVEKKFMRTLEKLFGKPKYTTPTAWAATQPHRRTDCYEVEILDAQFATIAAAQFDDLFGGVK